jgi:hypothetical protein
VSQRPVAGGASGPKVREIPVTLRSRYPETNEVFAGLFEMHLRKADTGEGHEPALLIEELGWASGNLLDPSPGKYEVLGRVTPRVLSANRTAKVEIPLAGQLLTLDVLFDIDVSSLANIPLFGTVEIKPKAKYVALEAVPTVVTRQRKVAINLGAGTHLDAEYKSDVSAKVGAKLATVAEGELTTSQAFGVSGGITASAGQETEFTVNYRRVTAVEIKLTA